MEQTIVAALGTFIGRVGFPVFVAVYVLTRLEPTINKLNDTVKVLTIITAKQSGVDYDSVVQDYKLQNGGKNK